MIMANSPHNEKPAIKKRPAIRVRRWLKENQIFFQTFAVLILSGMAIFVSWQANSIAEKQTQILRTGQTPLIRMVVDLVYNPESKKFTEDNLIIYNDGGALYDLSIYRAIFFKISYTKTGQSLQTALVPVIDYYGAAMRTANTKGKLVTVVNNTDNNLKHFEAEQSFMQFARNNDAFGSVEIERYVEISYKDIFDEYHSDIYYVDEINGSIKLADKSKGNQLMKLYNDALDKNAMVELSKITPQVLLDKWEAVQRLTKGQP